MGIVRKSELQAFAVDFTTGELLANFSVGAWDEDAKEWVGLPKGDLQKFKYAELTKEDAKKYNDVIGAVTAKALKDLESQKQASAVAAANSLAHKKERDEAVAAAIGLENSLGSARNYAVSEGRRADACYADYTEARDSLKRQRSLKSRLTFGLWT